MVHWSFDAIGTRWDVVTDRDVAPPVAAEVTAEIGRIDRVWSRFRSDSVVAELARGGGSAPLAPDDRRLLDLYRRLYDLTDGAVTPLVGRTIADAGYDPQYSLTPAAVISKVPAWSEVFDDSLDEIRLRRPWLLDVGAAGKGFAVDQVYALLRGAGHDEVLIDAGGDLRAAGRPRRIGLEHPTDPGTAIGVVTVTDEAICGSASNRRAWRDWHHIVDPATTRPTTDVLATWVVADDAMTADGLATALFFVPERRLRGAGIEFECVVVRSDGTFDRSTFPQLEMFT